MVLPVFNQPVVVLLLGQYWSLLFLEERDPSMDQRFKLLSKIISLFAHEIPLCLDHIQVAVFVSHSSSPCDGGNPIPYVPSFDVFIC